MRFRRRLYRVWEIRSESMKIVVEKESYGIFLEFRPSLRSDYT
ncbi:hypothetical protein SacRon12I_10250 [Sulfolobus acidocaldarius Ron12/I]|uniref:Uncharacterized protein n=1 Tax=Sulfolobus acidocaldarius Ron12/I TaxID=1028567 RepID=M1J4U7_9CREN|nr:hypothetical protein SacRon12I_10250 [Sulfolobus acidocaldarius Ron12/I]